MSPVHRACVAILLVLAPAVASAEAPPSSRVTLTAGGGVAVSDIPADDDDASPARTFRAGPGFQLDIAYRLDPRFAIGAHGGFVVSHGVEREHRSMFDVYFPYTYYSIDLGVTAQVRLLEDWLWLTPWIGINKLASSRYLFPPMDATGLGFGVEIGADVYQIGAHRAALMGSASLGLRGDPYSEYSVLGGAFLAFMVGAAYHY